MPIFESLCIKTVVLFARGFLACSLLFLKFQGDNQHFLNLILLFFNKSLTDFFEILHFTIMKKLDTDKRVSKTITDIHK